MDIQDNKAYTYFNGTLTGQVNQVFESIINCDITRPSYSKKKRPSHYALKKRKGYKRISVGVGELGVTDIKVIPGSSCGGTTEKKYLYLLSADKTHYEIWLWPTQCGYDATKVYEGTACACGYNKFTEVEYAIGLSKQISGSMFANGVQGSVVANNYSFTAGAPVQGRMSITGPVAINYGTGATQVNIGDYLVMRTGRASGQSKRVVGYDSARSELILDTPWSGFVTGTTSYDGHTASIYPKWGTTLLFADANGPIILNVGVTSTVATIQTIQLAIIENKCIADITVSSGIWNFLTSEGYVVFGNAGLNAAYYAGSELVGEQFDQVISFRGYNVFASKRKIKAGVVNTVESGYNQHLYSLSSDLGLWGTDAFVQFKNSLYILGSNKRLYTLSISSSGSSNVDPKLELTNMSDGIVGELDLIKTGDNVTLYADEKTLKIFIVSGGKTKILIYESDYGLWHMHKVLNGAINSYAEGYYIGDGLYQYCGNQDGNFNSLQFFEQKITALIGENEPNGIGFNSFQEKKLDFIKASIGPSILNEGSSMIKIDIDRWDNKSKVRYDQWNQIPWVKKYNDIFSGAVTTVDPCIVYGLTACETIVNEFPGSVNKDVTFLGQSSLLRTDLCQCSQEFYEESDMVAGYDSKAYHLADAYNVFVSTQELIQATIFRVSFIAGMGDNLWFNGFFAGAIPGAVEDNNGDNEDVLKSNCAMC